MSRKIHESHTRLGRIRVAAGYSQAQAARMLGHHQTLVSNWERGACRPDAEAVATMAGMYAVSEADILQAVERDQLAYPRRLLEKRRAR